MLHYLDRTFCKSDCTNDKCYKNFTVEHQSYAKRWAKDILGLDYAPVSKVDMSVGCFHYKKGD